MITNHFFIIANPVNLISSFLKMKLTILYVFVITFLILDACIEPYNLTLIANERIMVVDGMISDQPGPYVVHLFRSSNIDEALNTVLEVVGATITLKDDAGYAEKLREVSPGRYQTSASLKGIVGRTYHIEITTLDGEKFESVPEQLLPAGDIQNLYYEFEQVEDPTKSDSVDATKNGFNIFIDGTLDPLQDHLVRWRTIGIFEIIAFPQFHTVDITPPGPNAVKTLEPDPLPCSGWVYKQHKLQYVRECTCCDCWVSRYDEVPLLGDQQFVESNNLQRYKIAFIQANHRFFYKKYYFQVEQMSLSQNAYDFWESVKKQKLTSSDLFQTPVGKTSGNIISVGEIKAPVIGLFAASSVRKKSIFIDKNAIPYTLQLPDTVTESCFSLYNNSTNVKPPFW